MIKTSIAKFKIGQVIRHRVHAFRGVVFDVDAEFAEGNGTSESILVEQRSRRDQPFYYLLAQNDQNPYVAYVSEQNLLADDTGEPIGHPHTGVMFDSFRDGHYHPRQRQTH